MMRRILFAVAAVVALTPPAAAAPGPASTAQEGERLYGALKCRACHESGPAPTLSYAGSKMQPEWMRAYMLKPHRIRWADFDKRPVTRMPDYQLTEQEAERLTAYLDSLRDAKRFPEAKPRTGVARRAEYGKQLFAQYLCINCHIIDGDGEDYGPDLTRAGRRLKPGYLEAFLRDPAGVIPGNPMKDLKLWPEEAAALTDHLVGLTGPADKTARGKKRRLKQE